MKRNMIFKAVLGAAAAAAMVGAFSAQAQSTVNPPKTGEANDHTSPNAVKQPAGRITNATGNVNPGVVPPIVGEVNDHTSPNADPRPAAKVKPMKKRAKKARAPVTGEANDHSSTGGTTEAAKAAKAAKDASM